MVEQSLDSIARLIQILKREHVIEFDGCGVKLKFSSSAFIDRDAVSADDDHTPEEFSDGDE